MSELLPVPKTVRPVSIQAEFESRKLWQPVTEAILSKQYNAATRNKQIIEQAQRDVAAERTKKSEQHPVVLFDDDKRLESGRPALSEKGRQVLEEELRGLGYPSEDATTDKLKQMSLEDS